MQIVPCAGGGKKRTVGGALGNTCWASVVLFYVYTTV
jgi:hypothetical protein